jgi:hypothetical protein
MHRVSGSVQNYIALLVTTALVLAAILDNDSPVHSASSRSRSRRSSKSQQKKAVRAGLPGAHRGVSQAFRRLHNFVTYSLHA